MLIDTHAHVNFNAFRKDADEVIERSLKKEIFLINVGSQYSTSVRALRFSQEYEKGVWAAAGLHPIHLEQKNYVVSETSFELGKEEIKSVGEIFSYEKYRELGKQKGIVALGEVGLDYHHFQPGEEIEKIKTKQKEILRQFIQLARELKKPLILHCWDAYDDLYEILKKEEIPQKGVIHSFIGGYKTAKKFLELGFKIGLNGVITYSSSFDRLIKEIPLEKIVVETDCPYLTPAPKRGQRNEPIFVELVARHIAKLKGESFEKVAQITTQNAQECFSL